MLFAEVDQSKSKIKAKTKVIKMYRNINNTLRKFISIFLTITLFVGLFGISLINVSALDEATNTESATNNRLICSHLYGVLAVLTIH